MKCIQDATETTTEDQFINKIEISPFLQTEEHRTEHNITIYKKTRGTVIKSTEPTEDDENHRINDDKREHTYKNECRGRRKQKKKGERDALDAPNAIITIYFIATTVRVHTRYYTYIV